MGDHIHGLIVATNHPVHWVALKDGKIVHNGKTRVGSATASKELISDEDETEFLNKISRYAEDLPELPRHGVVNPGEIYRSQNDVVLVKKKHRRSDDREQMGRNKEFFHTKTNNPGNRGNSNRLF